MRYGFSIAAAGLLLFAVPLAMFRVNLATPALAADPWSDADKTREAIYLTLHVADWGQTLDIAKHPNLYTEENNVLGECPSAKRVNTYFATTALLHIAVVHFMPSSWRAAFQYSTIAMESGVIIKNNSVGIGINF